MLLDQVILELCEKGLQNAENENLRCFSDTVPSSSSIEDSITLDESSDSVNSSFLSTTFIDSETDCRGSQDKELKLSSDSVNSSFLSNTFIDSETDCRGSQEKELKLSLETNAKLCNSLKSQNLDSPSGSFRLQASVPFQWEEKPGKPKNPSAEKPILSLRLPPIRQTGLYSNVTDHRSSRKVPNNLSGKHKDPLQSRPSKPMSQVSKVPSGLEVYKNEFDKDFANSDLESIWEEEDEEEMLELCKKNFSSQTFQEIHSRRSSDLTCPETVEEYMLGIGSFADNSNRRIPPTKRGMISLSAEFTPRRFHSPWIGFRSTELGLHASDMEILRMTKNPCTDSPSHYKKDFSDCTRPSISRSPPALLANCLISVIDMSNAVPVEDSSFTNCKLPEENDISMPSKQDCMENDGSWPSLVQKSLSGQLRSSRKYHQELMRSKSIQAASSLDSLKRVSSIVKKTIWNSQGSLSREEKEMRSLEKLRKTQSRNPVKEEEYTDDEEEEEEDDDDYIPSSQELNVASIGQGSKCLKSSNRYCKDLVPLGSPDCNSCKELLPVGSPTRRSCKELMPFGRLKNCPPNISVASAKDDCPSNVDRHLRDGVLTKRSRDKHSKRTNHAKMPVFSLLFRNFMISCWFPSMTRLTNSNGLCRRSGTHTRQCIQKKQLYLPSHDHLQR